MGKESTTRPSTNLDLVRSIFVDWERGDFSRNDWADPNIEYVIADGPDPGSTRGLTAMAGRAREELRPAQNTRLAATEIRELDDHRVLVLISGSGHGKSSGIEVHYEELQVFDVCDGKVTRLTVYYESNRALADLGLAPTRGASEPTTVKRDRPTRA